mmetsp:Transcript_11516/g.20809  ORF Transcript_11516/g.20809 Transcript_11516/m.20809 type:complete len:108 (+) Transcript_11516:172-495(+)
MALAVATADCIESGSKQGSWQTCHTWWIIKCQLAPEPLLVAFPSPTMPSTIPNQITFTLHCTCTAKTMENTACMVRAVQGWGSLLFAGQHCRSPKTVDGTVIEFVAP